MVSLLVSPEDEVVHATLQAARYLVEGESTDDPLARVHPELRRELRAALRKVRARKSSFRTRPVALAIRGEPVCVVLDLRLMREDGQAGFVLVLFDTSAADVAAGKALRRRGARFRELAELSQEAIFVNADGGLAYVNAAMARLLGAERPEELLGRSALDFVDPAYHPLVRERVHAVLQSQRPVDRQGFEWRRLDGGRLDVEVVAGPIDWDGKAAVQVIARDVTEQRRTERAIQASEHRYKALFESLDEGLCVVEVLFDESGSPVDYRFLEVNPSFEKQTGIADPLGRRMREIEPNHEDHWFEIYGRVAKTGEPIRFTQPAESLGRIYDVYAFRVGEPEEHRVGILFNDVSERNALEDELRRTAGALAQSNQRKDDYLAMLGHELRNPLAAIRTAATVLNLTTDDDARRRRLSDVLERQTTHMTRLIDDLLDVSRISRGKVHLTVGAVDMRALLERVIDDRVAELAARGLRLTTDLGSESVWVLGDEVRLVQVIDNLVANAIKFTDAPGTVCVSLARAGSDAVTRVRDTGAGIRPALLAHMFEPFHQETQDMARSRGGLGLGLALAKGLVELHRGSIAARSDGIGQGAELEVHLPLTSAPREERGGGPSVGGASRRILVVEDNVDAAEVLRELLELRGHRAEVVESGPEALRYLRKTGVDVVLCDVGLPGMSGYDVARAVRSDEKLRDVPLVALTGYGQEEDRRRSADAGFDEHLVKPVSLDVLDGVLDRLEGSPARRRREADAPQAR